MEVEQFLGGLPKALLFLRNRAGFNQEQLAARARITNGMLSGYETGRNRPTLTTLIKLLAALECDLCDLNEALRVMTDPWTEEARKGRRSTLQTVNQLAQEHGEETPGKGRRHRKGRP
jgi:transcriptional regulator with XRE-family HTH domain